MGFVLLIWDDEVNAPTDEEMAAGPVHQAWVADLERRGDLDEAIEIAAGHPYTRWGGVEIRPVWEGPHPTTSGRP